MAIEIKMPALSPTMEEGTLAKWLVKEGDTVSSGDLLAEIETDKATMEFEAVDEGVIARILIPAGTDNVKVGTPIALLTEEGESTDSVTVPAESTPAPAPTPAPASSVAAPVAASVAAPVAVPGPATSGDRVKASPLARRVAEVKGVDIATLAGTGPGGRVVKADVEAAASGSAGSVASGVPVTAALAPVAVASTPSEIWYDETIPHEEEKLSNMRKTIARRLTEAKQTVPHIYLTVHMRLDALLALRADLNHALTGRHVKISVNDLLIKALALALEQTPKCNVTYAGTKLVKYSRADISVAVSTPAGLITPIIRDAAHKSVSAISNEMRALAGRAKEGKLKPEEYQGGTASLSNMGMFGISQFDAVINPPQGMILAVGAGERRPWAVNDELTVATVMTATGSFDHRAIDGADGAQLMKAIKELVENPIGLVA